MQTRGHFRDISRTKVGRMTSILVSMALMAMPITQYTLQEVHSNGYRVIKPNKKRQTAEESSCDWHGSHHRYLFNVCNGRIGGTGPRRAPDRDTVRFSYKWAVTPEKQRVPTVRAFGAELMKIGSGGSLEISSGGFRTWRTFQALNMVLAPVGLELEADPEGRGAGYRGGKWSLTSKNGWTLPFEDDMKLSAFPTRDWKRILPQLESLPEDVEFVVAKD